MLMLLLSVKLRFIKLTAPWQVTAKAPKLTRRSASSFTYSVTSGDTGTLYVFRTGRSETEYRLTV
jgi:hypothetical protein